MKLNKKKMQIAMIKKDLSVKDVAERYGCSSQAIRFMMNQDSVTLNTLTKLTKALGVDVTEIVDF